MKAPILIIVASAALATSAQAYTISSSNTLPVHPTSPIPVISTPIVLTNQTHSISDVERSPFDGTKFNDVGLFTSIEGKGSAIFNFTPTKNRKFSEFSLIWGSPDYYNKLVLFSGANGSGSAVATIYGNNPNIHDYDGSGNLISPTSPATGYSFVKIDHLQPFLSAELFNTPKDNAFEVSTLSAVPLPASAPLFGAALIALAGFGYLKRSKRTGATPA